MLPFEYVNLMSKNNANNYPRPETLSAILMSESAWTFTRHTYHSTIKDTFGSQYGGECFVFLFECSLTGCVRPWGTCYLDVRVHDGDEN